MKAFIKKNENFNCAHCGAVVKGDGYTNHCNNCLWSKDVDINPGDRKSDCMGLMKPIDIQPVKDHFVITHQCGKCGKIKRQKSADNDNMDAIIKLSVNPDFIFGK